MTTPHWPSTARLRRESTVLNSWGCTSKRTSPGPPTPADSEHSCKVHLCPSLLHPGHFPCTMLQYSYQYHEGPHPSLPQSLPAPTIRKTAIRASEPAPPDCSTAFSPRLWEPWTQIPPPLSETPYKPPTSWNMDHHTPQLHTPPNLTTSQKKTIFLCNSKCVTHRWVGLYKPPVVTHSPLFPLIFHTLLCVHNPTKDSIVYSGYGKYSDPLKFFTLCYIAAIC